MHLLRRSHVDPTHGTPAPRTELRLVDGRSDLVCRTCQQVIAYAVEPSRSVADDVFYGEQHAPFCRATC